MQIYKDCTAVGKHKQLMSASGLGAYHVLEADSIDWSSNTRSTPRIRAKKPTRPDKGGHGDLAQQVSSPQMLQIASSLRYLTDAVSLRNFTDTQGGACRLTKLEVDQIPKGAV